MITVLSVRMDVKAGVQETQVYRGLNKLPVLFFLIVWQSNRIVRSVAMPFKLRAK